MVFEDKIFWVHWKGDKVPEDNRTDFIRNIKRRTPNVSGVAIKTSNGQFWQGATDSNDAMAINGPEDVGRWARELARNGLQTYIWTVVRGDDIAQEARVTVEAARAPGVRALILDVEAGPAYFGGRSAADARSLINRIRNASPHGMHIALNFDARGSHPRTIHIDEWLPHVDSLHPMVYHWHFSSGTRPPETYLEEAFRVCRQWGKPIVPMLQTYADPASETDPPAHHVYNSGIYSFQLGAAGISYFRIGSEIPEHHEAIARIDPENIPEDEFENAETRTFMVATLALNVRSDPEVDARTLIPSAQLNRGDQIEVLEDSRTEAAGFVWWEHRAGWSAEKTVDEGEIYLIDLDADLPPPDFIFERSPVDLDALQWFYYYGNTVYAFINGSRADHGYDNYSQGLHGGLDYGHRGDVEVPIFAGVHGTLQYSGNQRAFRPNRVDVKVGNYTIIYGHVARPIAQPIGSAIRPDTIVGFMDRNAQHMHLEIRKGIHIVNPMLYLPEVQRDKILEDHPPTGNFGFYSSTAWQRWLTPYDQPTIVLGGPVIGPKA
jgi:murein DD-endopeptidase MepM/ murein hydrolase activator NlpD